MDQTLHEITGDYYMDVREFNGGSIEVVVKTTRPMHEGAIRSSADPDSHGNCLKAMGLGYWEVHGNGLKRVSADVDNDDPVVKKHENHNRAVRRSRQNVRWYVKQIQADRLLTLTYRKNQEDREEVKKHFQAFIRLLRKGWKGQGGMQDWQYVAVLEKQDRGSYHLHCAVRGFQNVNFLRKAWFKAIGGQGNETGEGTPGNIDITSPKKARWGTQRTEWQSAKLAAYLTKYLAKTFDIETNEKRRYFHSKDITAPVKSRFLLCAGSMLEAILEVKSIIELHYGYALDFSRSWMGRLEDSLWLSLGESVT